MTFRCWLRYDTHFVWAFIAPVILIILVGHIYHYDDIRQQFMIVCKNNML